MAQQQAMTAFLERFDSLWQRTQAHAMRNPFPPSVSLAGERNEGMATVHCFCQ
ncbi:hypothetical protein [Cupriavidus pauculus]|uniref:hypothetical protein n=1 Tax=Cupriavidus pauculus TaxID=82633 RepID=UPI0015DF1055|nr:hypothetical protein [Cupriavidus pauculus]